MTYARQRAMSLGLPTWGDVDEIEAAVLEAMAHERELCAATPAVDCPLPSCGAKAGRWCNEQQPGMQPVTPVRAPMVHAARIRALPPAQNWFWFSCAYVRPLYWHCNMNRLQDGNWVGNGTVDLTR